MQSERELNGSVCVCMCVHVCKCENARACMCVFWDPDNDATRPPQLPQRKLATMEAKLTISTDGQRR